jgi:FkbM family methyltransferase
MYFHSIYGMNYSSPNFSENGELVAMRYVCGKLAGTHPIVFDVGANVGDWSNAFLNQFLGDATIYAFEPASATFETLVRRTSGRLVHAHQCGLGDADGKSELFNADPDSTIASMYPLAQDHAWRTEAREAIIIRTVDSFCSEHGITKIDFLKLDIEGHEIAAIQGAQRMLKEGAVRFIQFEFGFRQMDSRTYFRDFWKMLSTQYQIFRIVQDGLYPILAYGQEREVFVGVSNYLAERVSI